MLPTNDFNSNNKSLAQQLEISTFDLELVRISKDLERRAQAKADRKAKVSMAVAAVSHLLLNLCLVLGSVLRAAPAQPPSK